MKLKMTKVTKPIAGVKHICLVLLVLLASCSTPSIVTKQRAVCVYNDQHRAEFEYRRTEHLNPIVTTYSARPGKYEVGRVYIIKIISK
jgi:hypothetical protein